MRIRRPPLHPETERPCVQVEELVQELEVAADHGQMYICERSRLSDNHALPCLRALDSWPKSRRFVGCARGLDPNDLPLRAYDRGHSGRSENECP
jgi:hypothetical protein